jgi:hypothetical protein
MEPLVLFVTAKPATLKKGVLLGMIGGLDSVALAKTVTTAMANPKRAIHKGHRFGIIKNLRFSEIIRSPPLGLSFKPCAHEQRQVLYDMAAPAVV